MKPIHVLAGAMLVIFIAACGGGSDDATTSPDVPPVVSEPIVPGAYISAMPKGQPLVGQAYNGRLVVALNDPRNRLTRFQVTNETAGGAPASIDVSGNITWAPNELDFQGTVRLRVTAELATGPAETYDVPVDVRKERIVLQVPIPATSGALADPGGRYLVKVDPEVAGTPMSGTLSIVETFAGNGAYRFSVRVPLTSNARVTVLDAPTSLQAAPAVAAQGASADGRKRALSMRSAVAPNARALGVSPGLAADIGQELGGNFLSGRHGLRAKDDWNIFTTRLAPFYYSIDQGGFRNTKSAEISDIFQIDGNCSTVESCRSSDMKRAPVILIHGFNFWESVGGGDGTWEKLTDALTAAGHPVFELRWNTYMRFEEAAGVLATLARQVAVLTGYRVNVVAHSFGGVVAHLAAMNKGIRFDGTQWNPVNVDGVLDRMITLGSPLSGIRYVPSPFSTDGVTLNLTGGRDSTDQGPFDIGVCTAITCFQAGSRERWSVEEINEMVGKISAIDSARIGLPDTNEGATIRTLHKAWKDGNGHTVPFATVVSLKWRPSEKEMEKKNIEALGDGLISMMGQAVDPFDFSKEPFVPRAQLVLDEDDGKLGRDFPGRLNKSTPSDMLRVNIGVRQYYFAVRAGHTSKKITWINENNKLYPIAMYPLNGRIDLDELKDDHPLKHIIDSASHLAAPRTEYAAVSSAPVALVQGRTFTEVMGLPTAAPLTFSLQLENAATGAAVTDWIVLKSAAGTGQFSFDAGRALAERFPLQSINVASFKVVLRAGGDLDSSRVIRRENLGAKTDLGDISIVPANSQALAAIQGAVIDGQTQASSIAGAELFFMKGLNQSVNLVVQVTDTATSRKATSNAFGRFEISGLEPGDYTVVARKDGYNIQQQGRVSVAADGVTTVSFSLLKVLTGRNAAITLRWSSRVIGGQVSSDLDSHLLRYDLSGRLGYHIYFSRKFGSATDSLDRDDTNYEGPETMTLSLDPTSRYVYYVHLYSTWNASLPGSAPKVIVRIGNVSLDYDLPSGETNTSLYWKVFEIVNGVVEPCSNNCLMESPPT